MSSATRNPTTLVTKQQLDNLLFGRKSLYPRQFSGEKIDDDVVLQLLEYANSAPNHKLTRPWHFVVFSEKALFDLVDFMKAHYLSNRVEDEILKKKIAAFDLRKEKVSHIIGLVCRHDEKVNLPEIEEIAAVACSVENIYLALNTFGLGGYWSTGEITYSKEIHEHLNLGRNDRFMGFFYLGKIGMDVPPTQKNSVQSNVTWKK